MISTLVSVLLAVGVVTCAIIATEATSSVTYTRWGREGCDGADLVYRGAASGSHSTQKGGASNYLCLPLTTEWGNYDTTCRNQGLLYGVEYETSVYSPFDGISSSGVTTLQDQDVPCAVCRRRNASSILMTPGRTSCFPGWKEEYVGYLMSGHIAHYRTEYICVDAKPEADIGGRANLDGSMLYSVEAKCGSLPCPPYGECRELACVMCSM